MAEQVRTAAPQWLATLLEDFATTACARVCADSAGAYANCLAVSVDCAEWLRVRGVECGLLCLAGSREPFPEGSGRWPFFDSRAIRHWTVRAGDWSIDWSARQFSPRADWPDVRHVDSLAAHWELVEDWACPRCAELVEHPLHRAASPDGLERAHRELSRATRGAGPFADPRHDLTPALVARCACRPVAGLSAQP